jgi:two-component system response regulator AtoC
MSKRTILIINEDVEISRQLSDLLAALGHNHLELSYTRAKAWLSEGNLPLLIFLNITQSGSAGLKLLASIREANSARPVVVVGSSNEIKLIVEAVQLGANDYLITPFDAQQVRNSIADTLEDQKQNEAKLTAPDLLLQGVFTNPEMKRACEIAKMVARTDVPVLITGESGVGKEVFARFIHSQSVRSRKSLIKVNCAALPTDLLESELFGYERGAFTGAISDKPGKFELADGGTILMDEIGDMSLHLQAKLLHVLQDGEFSRLGGKRQLRSDARIIASTNRKLEEAVSSGEFRNDLFFRLNVIRIKIPPLRERKEEIVVLTNYFIEKYREKYASPVRELPSNVLQTFLAYDWPGNVRQLENVIKRYLILNELEIESTDFPGQSPAKTSMAPEADTALPPRQAYSMSHPLPKEFGTKEFGSLKKVGEMAAETAEREVVLWMLEQTNWNRKLAARHLNICYKALLNKIKKWQVQRPPVTQPAGPQRKVAKVLASEREFAVSGTYNGHNPS